MSSLSCFAQDDIVLIARTSEGLKELLALVQYHCSDLKMKISVTKSKVLSKSMDLWELFEGDEVAGCLDKVLRFKYLGMESELSPLKGALAMRHRAINIARRYKAACLRVARDGPDAVEVAMCTWLNLAIPSVTYGCETVPFNVTSLSELDRQQMGVGKIVLGLPICAPHTAVEALLALRTVKEVIFSLQLKFFVRIRDQEDTRWSKNAFLEHLRGDWDSPYLKMIGDIKMEVGMLRGPVSSRHVDLVVRHHFIGQLNRRIFDLNLPALLRVEKRIRADHVDEILASKVVSVRRVFLQFLHLFEIYCLQLSQIVLKSKYHDLLSHFNSLFVCLSVRQKNPHWARGALLMQPSAGAGQKAL